MLTEEQKSCIYCHEPFMPISDDWSGPHFMLLIQKMGLKNGIEKFCKENNSYIRVRKVTETDIRYSSTREQLYDLRKYSYLLYSKLEEDINDGESAKYGINFCPKCGRPLVKEESTK